MSLQTVDILAVSGSSYLHRVTATCKLLTLLFMIISVLITKNIYLLSVLAASLLLFLHFNLNFSLLKQLTIYIYPLFFSLIYGFFFLSFTGEALLVVVLRALTAVILLLTLIVTTPYVKIFSTLNRVAPSVLLDIFFLTYRAFFLLLSKVLEILALLRLRGAMEGLSLRRRLTNMGSFFGLAFVKAIDLNEKNYWMMTVRGYEGAMYSKGERSFQGRDLLIYITSVLYFALAVLL
ncbi:CbiQ family ECF transporter T component [Heliorestis convoluta]|uniref:Cobalt transport family protein n=1 Tax=Heliorestis convoluta TaxID=356322 RepID=A0A5Q2MWD8_9FIRM|nr:CbiQ family ECF transporter T component [Heliorestis convoluta]QGG46774.1 cobalt transport family protein [Heliorestis convoluta]